MLCENGPVTSPVDPTLLAEHRRGHGALYDALNQGRVDADRLRTAPARLPPPKAADGHPVLAADVSPWLRPDAPTSPDRPLCHVHGPSGRSTGQFIPGRPHSFDTVPETAHTSWYHLLDTVHLGPDDNVTELTTKQVPPGFRGLDIESQDMVTLDADAYGYALGVVKGPLNEQRRAGLTRLMTVFERVLPAIDDEYATTYYTHVHNMAAIAAEIEAQRDM